MKREKKQQRWTCSMIVLLAMLLMPKTAWAVNGTLTTRTVAGNTYYEIADAKDLAAFSNLVSSRNTTTVTFHMDYNAILTNDITWDSSLTYNTIGVRCDDDMNTSGGCKAYTGIFDGNGHTIRSLRITKLRYTGTPFCGMFAELNGATVKNLTLTDLDFDNSGGYRYDGPISGSATGSTLSNVYVEGAAKSSGYWSYTGGLVGKSSGCTYTNCGANLVFTLIVYDGILAAGLVYKLSGKDTFTNCYFYGSFTGLKQGYYDLEGVTYTYTRQKAYPIYAENSGTATFTNCYAVTFQGNYGSEYTARNTNTGITYKEPSSFTSGEMAYLLNGSTNGGITWRQNITSGTVDNCPVLDQTHNKVYYLQDKYCTGANKGNAYYSNNSSAVTGVHTSLSKTAAKDATCTEAGNYDYWTCSGCKKVYSNANGTIVTTVAVRTIAALGHGSTGYDEYFTWSGTCYNDATKDTKVCRFSLRCKKCVTNVVKNISLTCTLTAHTDATCTTTGKTTYSATGSFTSTNSSYNYSATKTNDYTIAVQQDAHAFDNGICTRCGSCQPITYVTEDNLEELGLTSAYLGYCAISNSGQLYKYAEQINIGDRDHRYAVLLNDIVINENVLNDDGTLNGDGSEFRQWTPIGKEALPFQEATFDGRGHTISGLYFSSNTKQEAGLFGCIGTNGIVKNVGVTDCYINNSFTTDNGYVGGITGQNYGTIVNCYTTGTIHTEFAVVGGVCGRNHFKIKNGYSTVAVSTAGPYTAGGICAINVGSQIENCCTTANNVCGYGNYDDNSLSCLEAERFSNGFVCYSLNDNNSDYTSSPVWYQKLGPGGDASPVLIAASDGSNTVYQVYDMNCDGQINATIYSNQKINKITHTPVEGVCPCGEYREVKYIAADGSTKTELCRMITSYMLSLLDAENKYYILPSGWYAVSSTVDLEGKYLNMQDNAEYNLVLMDEAELKSSGFMVQVGKDATFNLYGQKQQTGKMYKYGSSGSDIIIQYFGCLNVYGGTCLGKIYGREDSSGSINNGNIEDLSVQNRLTINGGTCSGKIRCLNTSTTYIYNGKMTNIDSYGNLVIYGGEIINPNGFALSIDADSRVIIANCTLSGSPSAIANQLNNFGIVDLNSICFDAEGNVITSIVGKFSDKSALFESPHSYYRIVARTLGDVNMDGHYSVTDMAKIINVLNGNGIDRFDTGDMDRSGAIDKTDLRLLEKKILNVPGPVTGETDGQQWVQLWENGPKWAVMNYGAVATSYDGQTNYDAVGSYHANYVVSDLVKTLNNWRLPSVGDYEALMNTDNTVMTWCNGSDTQFATGCTLKGMKVTGKGKYAGSEIFFPAMGEMQYGDYYPVYYSRASCGYYFTDDSSNTMGIMFVVEDDGSKINWMSFDCSFYPLRMVVNEK